MDYDRKFLKDIAAYNLTDNGADSPIRLPDIQRGLVWKPRQIELLWDSILCGYPIGSLMIVRNELFDGQQRVNAITRGFDRDALLSEERLPESLLWLDLEFEQTESRYFGFRMTTRSHPWGYPVDGGTYPVRDRRAAMEDAAVDSNAAKSAWDIRRFRPRESRCPVPFPLIVEAVYEVAADAAPASGRAARFAGLVADRAIAFATKHPNRQPLPERVQIEARCAGLYDRLAAIATYVVFVCKIEIDRHELQRLELFFNRINTGGTPITQEELAYSAIKLYWNEQGLAATNAAIARSCMPAEKFAQIVFRAYCSKDRMRGAVSARDIRKLREEAEKGDPESLGIVQAVLEAYADGGRKLRRMQQRIDDWLLGEAHLPSFIRTEIAYNAPALYVLLFILARLQEEDPVLVGLTPAYIRALALYLYCCCNNANQVLLLLYRHLRSCIEQHRVLDQASVDRLLCEAISQGWAHLLHPRVADFAGFRPEALAQEWNIDTYQSAPYGRSVCAMFRYDAYGRQLTLLKVAEREAFNTFFRDYDPARRDLWEDSNRPWDDDHIVPKDWISRCGSWKKCAHNLIWSMGNFAHIPFEKNREKRNRNDWAFYEEKNHAALLHFDPAIKTLTAETMGEEAQIRRLAAATIGRFCKLYEAFAALLRPLDLRVETHPGLALRKRILFGVRARFVALHDAKCYYVADDRAGKEVQFDDTDEYGWMQQWVSLGVKEAGSGGLRCVTIGCYPDRYTVETGIRKNPDLEFSALETQEWWQHCEDSDCKDFQIDCDKMVDLEQDIMTWLTEASYWSRR